MLKMPFKRPTCLASPDSGKKSEETREEQMQIARIEYREEEIPENECGKCSVTLHKRDGIGLGITVSGGSDKESRAKISNMKSAGIAALSDRLQIGDYIISVNGIRTTKMRHAEIISLLKNVGDTVTLEIEYRLPPVTVQTASITQRTTDVVLRREKQGDSMGLLVRGGPKDNNMQSRAHVITHIRPGSPADKDGIIQSGDRIKCIDGNVIQYLSLEEVSDIIYHCPDETTFTIEYDVSVMDAIQHASGPLLVEVSKKPGSHLGVVLVISTHQKKRVICIEKILPASIADRCGALRIGDQVLSIDDVTMDLSAITLSEAIKLLQSTSDHIKLQILPVSQLAIEAPRFNRFAPTITSAQSLSALNSFPRHHKPHQGPGSTFRSTLGKGRRIKFQKSKYSASALSLTTVDYLSGNQVVHSESIEICLLAADNNCPPGSVASAYFGIQLQGGVFATEVLTSPPVIAFIENDSAAERCGRIQAGDRLLCINGCSTDNETVDEVNRMLAEAMEIGQVYVEIEYDVAESVVPSSGTFHVKLPKKREVDLGIIISASSTEYPNEPLVITEVRKGSVAHRTGTLQAGDRLLAIDGVKLDGGSTVEDALSLLLSAEEVVRLKIKKDEENSDDAETSGAISFTVELRRYGGPLGITISGTEGPLDPIIISGLTLGGLAHRTRAIHEGDQILSINNISLRAKPLSEAITLLQTAGETVTLKIRKQPMDNVHQCSQPTPYSSSRHPVSSSSDTIPRRDIMQEPIKEHSDPEDDMLFSQPMRSSESAHNSITEDQIQYGRIAPAGAASAEDIPVSHKEETHALSPDKTHQRSSSGPRPVRRKSDVLPRKKSNEIGSRNIETLRAKFEQSGRVSHSNTWNPRRVPSANEVQHDPPVADWQNALKDLQSVGQSNEIMRDLEQSIMTTGRVNVPSDILRHKHDNAQAHRRETAGWSRESLSSTGSSIQLHKITLQKKFENEDFGFSLSDGQLERGVFVHSTRTDGPADRGGIRPYDRLLQVNGIRTRDFDCCQAVPLIVQAGKRIVLVIARNPQNTSSAMSPHQVPLLAPPVNVPASHVLKSSAFQTL